MIVFEQKVKHISLEQEGSAAQGRSNTSHSFLMDCLVEHQLKESLSGGLESSSSCTAVELCNNKFFLWPGLIISQMCSGRYDAELYIPTLNLITVESVFHVSVIQML